MFEQCCCFLLHILNLDALHLLCADILMESEDGRSTKRCVDLVEEKVARFGKASVIATLFLKFLYWKILVCTHNGSLFPPTRFLSYFLLDGDVGGEASLD